MAALKSFLGLVFLGSVLAAPKANNILVNQAALEKVIDMMEESDDWMNTLKFMMKNSTKGFKVESRRILEYGGGSDDDGGSENPTTLTMVDEALPAVDMIEDVVGQETPSFTRNAFPPAVVPSSPTKVRGSQIIAGDVGICRTSYRVDKIFSAPLFREPSGSRKTLANPIPVMIGSCVSSQPVSSIGSQEGQCVLSAQPHIAWILVPVDDAKDHQHCVDIPGVTSVRKCAEWILIGGKCVYHV